MTQSPMVKNMIEHYIQDLRTGIEGHGLEMDKLDVFVSGDSNQYREKNEKQNDFVNNKPDYGKSIPVDVGPGQALSEPVWQNRIDPEETGINYFA